MFKTIASFAVGIVVGVAYASQPAPSPAPVQAIAQTGTPYTEMHSAIPHPAVEQLPIATF